MKKCDPSASQIFRRSSTWISLSALLALPIHLACADTSIHGRVTLLGTPPPEAVVKLDAVTQKLRPEGMRSRHYLVSEQGGLPNVVVHVLSAPEPIPVNPSPEKAVVQIRRGQLEPYMIAIQTNQLLAYRNLDPIGHNANVQVPRGSLNKERNFAMYPAPTGFPKSLGDFSNLLRDERHVPTANLETIDFPYPEFYIRLRCDAHPWLFAYVCVFDHAGFAVTHTDGHYRLPDNLPPGRYVLEARHRKLGSQTQEFTLAENERKTVDFIFVLPKD